jgi:hypothetical protein
MVTFTFRKHRQRRRLWRAKLLLKGIVKSLVSQSSITMEYLLPKHGRIRVLSQGKASLTQESMHSFNLEWLRDTFGNCKKQPALVCFMLNIDGRKLSVLTFGLMQSEQHVLFATKHQPSE